MSCWSPHLLKGSSEWGGCVEPTRYGKAGKVHAGKWSLQHTIFKTIYATDCDKARRKGEARHERKGRMDRTGQRRASALLIESGDLRSLVYISRAIALAFKYTTVTRAAWMLVAADERGAQTQDDLKQQSFFFVRRLRRRP